MRRIFAAIGIIIMVLSGGCSLLFLVPLVAQGFSGLGEVLPLVLAIDGIPFLIGLAIFAAARSGRRSGRQ